MSDSTGAPAPSRRTTTAIKFFPCNAEQDALFSVNPNVPTINALEQASCFLGSAREMAAITAEDINNEAAWATVYLLDMSKAVVDAAIGKISEEEHKNG